MHKNSKKDPVYRQGLNEFEPDYFVLNFLTIFDTIRPLPFSNLATERR